MIKPDGVQRGVIGRIITRFVFFIIRNPPYHKWQEFHEFHEFYYRFEDKGFRLVGLKMLMADDNVLEEHYAELKVLILNITKVLYRGSKL